MKKPLFFVAFALASSTLYPAVSQAQLVAAATKPAASLTDAELHAMGEGVAFPYELLQKALSGNYTATAGTPNVSADGSVFYSKIKGDNSLDTFVRAVAVADLTQFPSWTEPADPAVKGSLPTPDHTPETTFWINAYNGLFLKTIADAYPINTPAQIKDLETAKTHVVAGQKYTFPELRAKIAALDPRGLFALPNGTNSGPRASATVYRFVGLGAQLNAAIRSYVNDPTRVGPPDRIQNNVMVSPWLQTVDPFFKGKSTRAKWDGIHTILASYTDRGDTQRYFTAGDYQVQFMPADNSINEQLSR